MKNSGITWDEATLQGVHRRPEEEGPRQQDALPAGVKDELERDDLLAYLKSFNADGSSKK